MAILAKLSQEIVDVILGYGEYPNPKGSKFNDFEKSLEKVSTGN